jgi:hypothetical protein
MNYELAKELKDGGFPQNGSGKLIGPADSLVWRHADRVYMPTLEDLLGSLGNHFYSLGRIGPHKWRAQSFATKDMRHDDRTPLIGHKVDAILPDIALARLWLALHANRDATA